MDIAVTTRPVRPTDQKLFCRLWGRLSRETVYRRFHAPVHALPDETVRRPVTVDHDLREALVAVVGDEVVGVARYDRAPADRATAEVAVVVEDAWQGVGVGRQLVQELIALAGRRGVRTVTATRNATLPSEMTCANNSRVNFRTASSMSARAVRSVGNVSTLLCERGM